VLIVISMFLAGAAVRSSKHGEKAQQAT